MKKPIHIKEGDILLQRCYPARNSREASFRDRYYIPTKMKVIRVDPEKETAVIRGTESGEETTYSLKQLEGHYAAIPCPNNQEITDVVPVSGHLPNWHAPGVVDHFEPRLCESQAPTAQKEEWTRIARRETDRFSGPTQFGVESYESAKSRGAYTGSKANFERYSKVARSNIRDAKKKKEDDEKIEI